MKKILFIAILLMAFCSYGQVFDGLRLVPKTTTQINATISPLEGDLEWNSTTHTLWQYNGSLWIDTGAGGGSADGVVTAGVVSGNSLTLTVQGQSDVIIDVSSLVGGGSATTNAADLTSGVLANGRVQETNVTQHEGALSITESQISDLSHTIDTKNSQAETKANVDAEYPAIGNLSGTNTGDQDLTLYFLKDGSQVMTGDLRMSDNDIYEVKELRWDDPILGVNTMSAQIVATDDFTLFPSGGGKTITYNFPADEWRYDGAELGSGGGSSLPPTKYTQSEFDALTGAALTAAKNNSIVYEIGNATPSSENPDILYVQRTTGGAIDNTWATGANGEQVVNVLNNTSAQTWTLGSGFTLNQDIQVVLEGAFDAFILPESGTNIVGMADDNSGNIALTAGQGVKLRQFIKAKFERETATKFWFYGSAEPYTN